jgi:hypothetical protein
MAPDKGCADATFSEDGTTTLREHDPRIMGTFVDLLKLNSQAEMLWKISGSGYQRLILRVECTPGWWRNLKGFSRQAVKQATVAPCSHLCHHAVSTLSTKWDFTAPDFRWFLHSSWKQAARTLRGIIHQGTMFSFFKSIMSMIRPSFFSAAEK